MICDHKTYMRGGQNVLVTILFLFSWVHLHEDGSFYIKYMNLRLSFHLIWTVLHAWSHCSINIKTMLFGHYLSSKIGGKFEWQENQVGAF